MALLRTTETLTSSKNALQCRRSLTTFTLPDLPYDYGALEPAIGGQIMQIHQQKHHQTYVTNYNNALQQLHDASEKVDASAVVKLQRAIKFNGGGFFLFSSSLYRFFRVFRFDFVDVRVCDHVIIYKIRFICQIISLIKYDRMVLVTVRTIKFDSVTFLVF